MTYDTISTYITINTSSITIINGGAVTMNPIKMYQIEVDEEVYSFLKQNAEPFKDTTPNSVLRRFLPLGKKQDQIQDDVRQVFPKYPDGTPKALEQILDMIVLVKNEGLDRVEATKTIADLIGRKRETVMDKYCRQLGKKAYEIDELLMTQNIDKLETLLVEKFPNHKKVIESTFGKIKR